MWVKNTIVPNKNLFVKGKLHQNHPMPNHPKPIPRKNPIGTVKGKIMKHLAKPSKTSDGPPLGFSFLTQGPGPAEAFDGGRRALA